MTGSAATTAVQLRLSLEQIDARLDQAEGNEIRLPIDSSQIGAQLLSILSQGLYTNPLDSIREYVQNGVDADAHKVTIAITGNSVAIMDDGHGMSLERLLEAREFGLSPKSLRDHVGFRGIGIYSGFDLCERMHVTTKQGGENIQHVLIFDFAAMRSVLTDDRLNTSQSQKTSLIDLLSNHTYVKREPSTVPLEQHFTIVLLDNISDVHMRRISNRTELKSYLLQNLPVGFASNFEHEAQITSRLKTSVPGFRAIRILLQSDGIPDDVVAKYDDVQFNLQPPKWGFISTSSGKQVAFYWACLNANRSKLQPKSRDGSQALRPSYEGLVYKVKGFTIGDRRRIGDIWQKVNGKSHLYPWYTGEVYVLDPDVIPNAERDDFETSSAKRSLEAAIGDVLETLEDEVESFQSVGVANTRIDECVHQFELIANQIEANTHPVDLDTLLSLKELRKKIDEHKKSADTDRRDLAERTLKLIDRLQLRLRKDVDSNLPEEKRRRRAAKKKSTPDHSSVPTPQPAPPPLPAKSLQDVLQEFGWEPESTSMRLIEVLQESLDTVLSRESAYYHNLIADLESRFGANMPDL